METAIQHQRPCRRWLLEQLKKTLTCHRLLGITSYPRSEQVERFLRTAVESSRPAPAKAAGVAQDRRAEVVPTDPRSLSRTVAACTACPLAAQARPAVSIPAQVQDIVLMVVADAASGEPPGGWFGAEEEAMVWRMMAAIGLDRSQVHVTALCKCPVKDPGQIEPEWGQRCLVHLRQEIRLIEPRAVLAMGELTGRCLLAAKAPLARLRGRISRLPWPELGAIRCMVTYHPRVLLQMPELKRLTWQDLQMVQRVLTSNRSQDW